MPTPVVDLVGKPYSRLTVLSHHRSTARGRHYWWCRCECGTELSVRGDCLKDGNTQSCGCQKIDSATKHGHSAGGRGRAGLPSRTYNTWQAMRDRCTKPTNPHFPWYGGRGIKLCDRWRVFANFLADMGEKPAGTSIDRIDNGGDYEPGNCRWATPKQQSWNRRTTRMVTHDGATKPLCEWAEENGLPRLVVQGRLLLGWSFERAISTPYTPRKPKGANQAIVSTPVVPSKSTVRVSPLASVTVLE